MLARCSILYKLLIGASLLLLIVLVLSVSGLLGVNSYREFGPYGQFSRGRIAVGRRADAQCCRASHYVQPVPSSLLCG